MPENVGKQMAIHNPGSRYILIVLATTFFFMLAVTFLVSLFL